MGDSFEVGPTWLWLTLTVVVVMVFAVMIGVTIGQAFVWNETSDDRKRAATQGAVTGSIVGGFLGLVISAGLYALEQLEIFHVS